MAIDIIIPIYNAYDDLKICLESIYQYTDLLNNRLILINDNSSDERIKSFLDEQKKENVIVIHNEKNKGFSNNINLGMSQSEDKDVILLNSDTIVTKNWVEKMVACAYSDSSIGTVTPLSNNATLCSVPNFCEENTLPDGMTVDQMATIVEECSFKKYPRITVAHGFCMLVKREVIDSIGMFDAETFGRGYGEENDFCNRAEQMGYIHVMCDDTYIYHSGTKSFISKEKEQYIREHDRILNERYPQQMHNNALHCQENPNGWVGKNIEYHMDIWNGKKNVLYLLQSDFKEGSDDNVGGTQLHVKHLTMGMRNDMNIFVAARDLEYLQVTAYVGKKEHTFRFYIGKKEPYPLLKNRELAQIFKSILVEFRIDLVHVHHTITTSLDIYYEADKLGIPVIFTAHDFYYVCPNEKLLDSEGNVCIDNSNPDCEKCLKEKKTIYDKNDYLSMWRSQHGKVLDICKKIVVPSKSTKEILGSYYPEYRDKIEVIEHGMDKQPNLQIDESEIVETDKLVWKIEKVKYNKNTIFVCGTACLNDSKENFDKVILKLTYKNGKSFYFPTTYGRNSDVLRDDKRFYAYIPYTLSDDKSFKIEVILYNKGCYYTNKEKKIIKNNYLYQKEKFRVAFIGGINEEKGAKIVHDVIKKGASDVEWYVIGGIGDSTLFNLKQGNLIKTGMYYQEDLSTLLSFYKIDIICILSKWPETFSYTLSESIVNKIPVITTNIGALGQRVDDNKYGISINLENADTEIINHINNLKANKNEYCLIKEQASRYFHKEINDMIEEYKILYVNMEKFFNVEKKSCYERENVDLFFCGSEISNEGNHELTYRIKMLEERINKIENTAAYKLMQRAYQLNIPFKKEIRNIILKH